MPRVHIIYEDIERTESIIQVLEDQKLKIERVNFDKSEKKPAIFHNIAPPNGIFYNRTSASSWTRGNADTPHMAHHYIKWLESHGRRVINGSDALALELSKADQYAGLRKYGIKTPRTAVAVGRDCLLDTARGFGGIHFYIKPNCGGSGEGIQYCTKPDDATDYPNEEPEHAGATYVVQEYIEPKDGKITRCEFVGGKFIYALSIRVDDPRQPNNCPSDPCSGDGRPEEIKGSKKTNRFEIIEDFKNPIIEKYERFLAGNNIEISAIEFAQDFQGEIFTFDVNTNTNYNSMAEHEAGTYGAQEIARFFQSELASL